MSVFIDTGVFYAHRDTDAVRHDAARAFFDCVLDGVYERTDPIRSRTECFTYRRRASDWRRACTADVAR